MRLVVAMDRCEGEMRRNGCGDESCRSYRRYWELFGDMLGREAEIHDATRDDCRRFLDGYVDRAPSTQCVVISAMRKLFKFLVDDGDLDVSPMDGISRPKRPAPEDTHVVSVATDQVTLMLEACENWQEFLCVTTPAYLGPRRKAISNARRGDVDLRNGTIQFTEKYGRIIHKPLPAEYRLILQAADEAGVWNSHRDYLVPNRRPGAVRNKVRSDKVIWDTIKQVAERALGDRDLCHVHALRAAFAVAFDEAHPDRLHALKELMGHKRIETTLIYLRRKNRARDMEAVVDLSWGGGLEVASGYRPLPVRPIRDSNPCYQRTSVSPRKDGDTPGSVPFSVSAKLDELAARASRLRAE